jgi:hypothetical protein
VEVDARKYADFKEEGEKGINTFRDKAKEIARQLSLEGEYAKLNTIISALLQTHPANVLSSDVAKARAAGMPTLPSAILWLKRYL